MDDLVTFLRDLVMTTVQIDKKYRETIPDIIKKVQNHAQASDDETGPRAKKRKVKRMRLRKDGLYPREEEQVRKWWSAHRPQLTAEDSMTTAVPAETRLQISCLRSRETQLQMILILEILALEPLRHVEDAKESGLPRLDNDEAAGDSSREASTKKRSKHNFPVLLDVHADRLSIWQTTALDEVKLFDESQAGQAREAQDAEMSTLSTRPQHVY
jgi:DNA replication regulator SLD3